MKALTVHQPWAWALIHADKTENRTWATAYRGQVAIHAGKRLSERGFDFEPMVQAFMAAGLGRDESVDPLPMGAIIGVATLVDVHLEEGGCCKPWGETSYVEHGGRTRTDIYHWVFEDRVALDEPVRCRGAQQLWTVPAGVDDQVHLQLEVPQHEHPMRSGEPGMPTDHGTVIENVVSPS